MVKNTAIQNGSDNQTRAAACFVPIVLDNLSDWSTVVIAEQRIREVIKNSGDYGP